jgi:5-methylcytosine-specific restriction protein B
MPESIPFYNALDPSQIAAAADAVAKALDAALSSPKEDAFDIPPSPDLIGIDPAVYRQIRGALNAGKQHLLFYGPPGTGKTSIAEYVADRLNDGDYKLITGSSDWTSQDIIGGYQPVADGGLRFAPGVLLENFDKPLIIDELNRCDIDKVLGPLFTVLSNKATTLPYQIDPNDPKSPRCVIYPSPTSEVAKHEYAPTADWRILATINSIDKASLYQMSYALARRFGWILIDVPSDLRSFFVEYCTIKRNIQPSEVTCQDPPIVSIWSAVNDARRMGPAAFIDMLNLCFANKPDLDPYAAATDITRPFYLDGFYNFVMPMLDGILQHQAIEIASAVTAALGIPDGSAEAKALHARMSELGI